MNRHLVAVSALALALLLALLPKTAFAVECAGAAITGTAFRDYNANGMRDAREPGIQGIVVTALDANGTSVTCTTTGDGSYGIDPAGAFPMRVEFTLPADGSVDFLRAGAAGAGSRTSVTFVAAPSSGVDVGFNHPAQYCSGDSVPRLATACYAYGEQNDNPDGINKDTAVLFSFPYGAGSTDQANDAAVRTPAPTAVAVAKQIGSVWGLAWNPHTETLYAAAFLKRHAGFGPSGPGAIYQLTASGAGLYHDFGNAAGTDPHPQPGQTCLNPARPGTNDSFNCWLYDTDAFDQVGKVGFGDLEIGDDFATLYTINLANRSLLSIPIANPGAFAAIPVPVPASCPVADLRPFGLGVEDGVVYVGAVCTAESTQNRNNLRAYVFAYAGSAFIATPVLDFALTYDRGAANRQWQYWLNRTTLNPSVPTQADGRWAQPWLADIAFDRGDMILALRDRNADLFGAGARGPDPSSLQDYFAKGQGDLLRACATGAGGWSLESNGSCGGAPTAGAGTGQGPGSGEFYFQDRQATPLVEETSWGSLAQVPGRPEVAAAAYGPVELAGATGDGGVKWYDNGTGTAARGYLVFDGTGDSVRFAQADAVGDLTALCPGPPLEIGNRIWRDGDGDGIQDPGEAGLDGVTVELYQNGTLVGATTTANDGNYLFGDSNVVLNGAAGIHAGICGAGGAPAYAVRVPNAAGASQQPALAGLLLTGAGQDGTINGRLRDSDAQPGGADVVAAIACAELAAPGDNNHTVDIGFRPPFPPVAGVQALFTDEDTALEITVGATDPENQALAYTLVAAPAHGTLSGNLPKVSYTPAPNFFGTDSFTFKANNGFADSNVATVRIDVAAVNDAPVAESQVLTTTMGTSVSFTLAASDPDGDAFFYIFDNTLPFGPVTGNAPHLLYTPASGFAGEYQFMFRVTDGQAESSLATITIHVIAAHGLFLPLVTGTQ